MKRKDGTKTRVLRPRIRQPHDPTIRHIALTQNQIAIVDAADYDWLMQWNWCAQKREDGRYYVLRYERLPVKRWIYMHRVLLNCKDNELADHKNGNGLDNRRENLRTTDYTGNSRNERMNKRNTSGFKGVGWMKELKRRNGGRWYACIVVNAKRIFLGYHPTKEDAARAYNEAAIKHHGEFANLNKIE